MWQIIDMIKSFLGFGTSVSNAVEKSLPTDKMQEDKFEIQKPTLTESQVKKIADKRNKLADEMYGDLVHHPEISIENKVNFECSELNPEERELLISILTERLMANTIYAKKKNKKSKFRLG